MIDERTTFSWARHRQIAWAIFKSAKMGFFPGLNDIESIADLASSGTAMRIWITQSESTIHETLKSLDGYFGSEFFPNKRLRSGDFVTVDGRKIRHEDLMNPSFPQNSLDLVISTEVFEHIPYPYLAHRRVHGILKIGGVHVFTVPFFSDKKSDSVFATLDIDGEVNFIGPPVMHGDPIRSEGVPVFTIFGQEMINKLCIIGFDTYAYMIHIPREGILGSGAIVFIARKM